MIAVLSRDYFESDWCTLEIALMRHREVLCGYRTGQNPRGLIIPVIIDDGDHFPPEVQEIQGQKIHDFANPFMRIDSPRQEEFAEALRTKLCVDIQNAIQFVPAFDPQWRNAAVENFEARFKVQLQDTYALPILHLGAST